MLLSSFFWSYALLQIPAGWLVDRWGVKWTYAAGFVLWSIASGMTALAGSLSVLLIFPIMQGIGQSIVTPASMRYLRMNFTEKRRGLAIGIYMSGTKYGPALGGLICAPLVVHLGWRWMFVVTGLCSLPWLLPWLLLVNETPAALRPAASKPGSPLPGTWKLVLGTPVMWGTCVATFAYMYFVYFCMTWMPIYFTNKHHLSLKSSGWFTAFSFGGMATIAIIAGYAADRLIARGWDPVAVRKGFTIAGFLLACTEVVAVYTTSIPVALFFTIFSLSGLGLATANYWALTQTLMPARVIGTVSGVQNTAANLAGICAPWITGTLIQKTGSYNAPLLAIVVWLVLGVSAYIFWVKREYAPHLEAD
jgi:MFS family permease